MSDQPPEQLTGDRPVGANVEVPSQEPDPPEQVEGEDVTPEVRRSTRVRHPPVRFGDTMFSN